MQNTFNTLIITAGISILNPRNVFGILLNKANIVRQERNQLIKIDEKLTDNEVIKTIEHFLNNNNNIQKIAGQETEISAEFSIMYYLKKENRLDNHLLLHLIHSDSFGGECTKAILTIILQQYFNVDKVICHKIDDLNMSDSDSQKIRKSLGGYMTKLGAIFKDLEGNSKVCFAPIGGFKVMTSLGYVAGAFYGFPSFYLHESGNYLHEIPAVPIAINESVIKENADLFCKLKYEELIYLNQLNYNEQNFIKNNRFFFDIVDDMIGLNAFGIFIVNSDQYKQFFDTKIFCSPDAKREWDKMNDEEKKNFKNRIEKIKNDPRNDFLYHELSIKTLKQILPNLHLYKSNRMQFRFLWEMPTQNKLRVKYIWNNHDIYEKDINGSMYTDDIPEDKYIDISAQYYAI